MAASTWLWNGSSWTLESGPGNVKDSPQAGDTAIVPSGTVTGQNDPNLQDVTIELGGTATPATGIFPGDFGVTFATPTFDAQTLIDNNVPNQTTPEQSILDLPGVSVNEGTILADGPAGSTFTLTVSATETTQLVPGYFFNAGTIMADAGNTVVINVGATSALYNTGSIIADGGTVIINASSSALWGGQTPVRGFDVIEGGGTLITDVGTPSSVGDNGTHQEVIFADSTSGNTLKIENISEFNEGIGGFTAGDTIDLGALLAVGTISYNGATDILELEAANGTVLASLLIGNPGTNYNTGTFALVNGTADGFILSTGADDDTILTSDNPRLNTTNVSGTWQSGSVWVSGTMPGTIDHADIGVGATSPFTLTTGSLPVVTGVFSVSSSLASVDITSAMTLGTGDVSIFAGTVDVAASGTLSADAMILYGPLASFTISAGATADLSGRLNTTLEPTDGVYSILPGGDPYALVVSGGTVVIDGALNAGPTESQRGGSVSIAYDGDASAEVIVNAGATVSDTHTTIGSTPGAAGTLIVDGGIWNDQIDSQDTASSRGNLDLGFNDLGSSIASSLPEQGPIGPAILVIENNGTANEQESAQIAGSIFTEATAVVESGGVWNIGSAGAGAGLSVGDGGAGVLDILAGGTVNVFSGGTFLSNGASFSSGGIGIGQNATSSTGTLLVSGAGALLNVSGGIADGKQGQGFLEVTNGGSLRFNSGGLIVGSNAGANSSGTLLVGGTGPGVVNFATSASGFTVGDGSGDNGVVIISDGGTIANNSTTGFVTVGAASGANGTLIVGGTTSSAILTISTAGLTIGNAGTGTAVVNANGTISIDGTLGISLLVGQSAGARGELVVDGGVVNLGPTSTGLTVGLGAGANGSVQVENGGALDTQSNIEVGSAGTGTLIASNLSTVTARDLTIGGGTGGALGSQPNLVSLTTGADATFGSAVYVWANSTLALDSTSAIDIGPGGDFTGGAVNIQSGDSLVGAGTVEASIIDNGQITAAENATVTGTLDIAGNVTGGGTVIIGDNAILNIGGTVSSSLPISFTGDSELILTARGGTLSNALNNFAAGDTIIVDTPVAGTFVALGSTQVAIMSGATQLGIIGFATPVQANTALSTPGALVDNVVPCFAANTRIRTARGLIPVEDLREGDAVWSMLRQTFQPVVWIGQRIVDCGKHPAPHKVWPVRIAANTFGPAQPERDLYVSPDHALYIDDVLVPAKRLINGKTIQQIETGTVAYYHIELRQHDVLLAEGLPAESYLDTGDRAGFANAGVVATLHPSWGDTWELEGCAPLVVHGATLEAIRRRLAA